MAVLSINTGSLAPRGGERTVECVGSTNRLVFNFNCAATQRVSAAVLTNSEIRRPIEHSKLPVEIREIQEQDELNAFLSSTRFTLSESEDQTIKIFITSTDNSRKSAYRQAFESFRRYVSELANCNLCNDISEKLEEFSRAEDANVWLSGLDYHFRDFTLPEEGEKRLHELSLTLPTKRSSEIVAELLDLAKNCKKDSESWNELNVLLNLKQFRKLPSETQTVLIGIIHSDHDPTYFRGVATPYLQSDRKEIDLFLKSPSNQVPRLKNLNTLLAEVIKKRNPVMRANGILSYIKKQSDCFVGSTIHIKDPESNFEYKDIVDRCNKAKESNIEFITEKKEKIVVENKSNVSIISESIICFSSVFISQSLKENAILKITPLPMSDDKRPLLPQGTYRYIREAVEGGIKYAYLDMIDKPSAEYRIKARWKKVTETVSKYYEITSEILVQRGTGDAWQAFNSTEVSLKDAKQQLQVSLIETKICSGVNSENINNCVFFTNFQETRFLKYEIESKIKAQEMGIVNYLAAPDHSHVLNASLRALVWVDFTNIDMQSVSQLCNGPSDIEVLSELLKTVVENYKKLEIIKAPGEILASVTLKASYAVLNKDVDASIKATTGSVQIHDLYHAVGLLKQSEEQLEKIKGKKVVLFLGDTGAGKSTLISYFLGAELEDYQKAGEGTAVRISSEDENADSYPIIGDATSESETKFITGHSLGDPEVMLCDCPGFEDTRGLAYQICTKLSIDRVVQECASVEAICLVVPMAALREGKAMTFVRQIQSLNNRFPMLFHKGQTYQNTRLHVFVTKQSTDESVRQEYIRGNPFKRFLAEAKRQASLSQLTRITTLEAPHENFLFNHDSRIVLWSRLADMKDNSRVHHVDILNASEREHFLKLILDPNATCIDKNEYRTTFESESSQRMLADIIHLACMSWTIQIGKYMYGFSDPIDRMLESNDIKSGILREIQEVNQECDRLNNEIKQIKTSQKELQEELRDCDNRLMEINRTIFQLKDAQEKKQLNGSLSEELIDELKKKVESTRCQELEVIDQEIAAYTKKIKELNTKISEEVKKCSGYNKEEEEIRQKLENKRAEIKTKSDGNEEIIIANYQPGKDDEATLQYLNLGVFDRCIDERRSATDKEIFKTETKRYSAIDGEIEHYFFKDTKNEQHEFPRYWPVEGDMNIQNNIGTENGVGKCSMVVKDEQDQTYQVLIEGQYFSVKTSKVCDNGKKIAIAFTTYWNSKRGELPSFKVTHKIPNAVYYSSSIAGLKTKEKSLQQNLDNAAKNYQISMDEIDRLKEELRNTEKLLDDAIRSKQRNEDQWASDEIDPMLKEQEAQSQQRLKKLEELKNDDASKKKLIKDCENKLELEQQKLKELIIEKQNLAILIASEQKRIEVLATLAQKLIDPYQRNLNYIPKDSINACGRFVDFYTPDLKDTIFKECKKDLQSIKDLKNY